MTNLDDWPARRLRHAVELEAEVHYPDGHSSKATVSNLSLDGCRLSGWFRIGDHLEIDIPKIGRVKGQVRWALAGSAGVRFVKDAESDRNEG